MINYVYNVYTCPGANLYRCLSTKCSPFSVNSWKQRAHDNLSFDWHRCPRSRRCPSWCDMYWNVVKARYWRSKLSPCVVASSAVAGLLAFHPNSRGTLPSQWCPPVAEDGFFYPTKKRIIQESSACRFIELLLRKALMSLIDWTFTFKSQGNLQGTMVKVRMLVCQCYRGWRGITAKRRLGMTLQFFAVCIRANLCCLENAKVPRTSKKKARQPQPRNRICGSPTPSCCWRSYAEPSPSYWKAAKRK